MSQHLRIVIDATSACNRGCAHCGRDSGMKDISHIDQPTIEALTGQLEKLKHEHIRLSFTGGEPLLNPFLPEYIQHCSAVLKKRLKEVSVVTSGFLPEAVDEDACLQKIIEGYDSECLHISLSFSLFLPRAKERLCQTLQFLLKSGRRIGFLSINLCSSRENFWQTYEQLFEALNCVEIMAATPMHEILVQTWNPMFRIRDFSNKIWSPAKLDRLNEKSYSLPCHMLLDMKQAKQTKLVISPFSFSRDGRARKLNDRPWGGRGCSFLFSFYDTCREEIHLSTDGSLYPDCGCLCAPELKIGNITDDLRMSLKIKEVLSSVLFRRILSNKNIFSSHTMCEACRSIMREVKYTS